MGPSGCTFTASGIEEGEQGGDGRVSPGHKGESHWWRRPRAPARWSSAPADAAGSSGYCSAPPAANSCATPSRQWWWFGRTEVIEGAGRSPSRVTSPGMMTDKEGRISAVWSAVWVASMSVVLSIAVKVLPPGCVDCGSPTGWDSPRARPGSWRFPHCCGSRALGFCWCFPRSSSAASWPPGAP